MRKLLTVLVAGGLVVILVTPAFGGSVATKRSGDAQITATRHGGGPDGDGGGRYRRNSGRDDSHRGWRHRRHLWDDAVRNGHRRRSYYSYYGYPYYGGYYEYPSDGRRAYARERECNDAYSYDRVFYDRYCRDGSAGRFRYRSPSGYPDQPSPPAGQPAPALETTAPTPDQMSPPADQTNPAPHHPTAPSDQTASPAPSQSASPSSGAPGSERFRDPLLMPPWAGYGTGVPGPAGPPRPVGGVSY